MTSSLILAAARLYHGMQEGFRWRAARDRSAVRVFYGYARLPSRGEHASGGIVKCQDLAVPFPNDPARPNLLYLVSSALPPFFEQMMDAARRAGAAIVLNQNGVAYPGWHGPGWEETNRRLAAAYRQADVVIYQSEFCRLSAQRFLAARTEPGVVLHNPVDIEVFRPAPEPPPGGPVLLCAGSHHAAYRVLAAIETLAALRASHPNARLLLAGRYLWCAQEDECRREIASHARQCGVGAAVDVLGAYTQDEAPALMRRAHVLLHSTFQDACPRVVVEAMACGVPVVFSATGGVPELVGSDAGRGVPGRLDWERVHPPDPLALAVAASEILADHLSFSRAARARAEAHFNVGHWLDRHGDIFRQQLGCA